MLMYGYFILQAACTDDIEGTWRIRGDKVALML
jgi:hypothetical protein